MKVLTSAGFSVTAIQRADSKNVAAEASNSLKVDLSSESALAAAFKGQDVVVSAVPNPKLSSQKVWMNAAISASVKRIVPSEFSSNIERKASRKLPIVKDKLEVRAYVEEIPIYIYSAAVSERQMHDVVKKITAIEFEEVHVSIDAVIKETQEAMQKGDMSKMMNFYLPFCFGKGYGGDFRDIASNETLGLKKMTDEELEESVKAILKEAGVY